MHIQKCVSVFAVVVVRRQKGDGWDIIVGGGRSVCRGLGWGFSVEAPVRGEKNLGDVGKVVVRGGAKTLQSTDISEQDT